MFRVQASCFAKVLNGIWASLQCRRTNSEEILKQNYAESKNFPLCFYSYILILIHGAGLINKLQTANVTIQVNFRSFDFFNEVL